MIKQRSARRASVHESAARDSRCEAFTDEGTSNQSRCAIALLRRRARSSRRSSMLPLIGGRVRSAGVPEPATCGGMGGGGWPQEGSVPDVLP